MTEVRILHILGTAQPGGTGVARIVGAINSGLNPARFRTHAWFLESDGPLVAELANLGIEARVVPWSKGLKNPVGMWRFWMRLCEEKFGIVHQHYGGRALRWVVHLRNDSRVLVHLHGRIVENEGTRLIYPNLQLSDFVIATSHAVAKRVKDVPVQVVYPGVHVGPRAGQTLMRPSQAGQIVGTAARLVPAKGMIHLIRAMSFLRSRVSGVLLEIAGFGPQESALRREVQKLGLGTCVKFLSWQNDLAPLFARWDVFVLPSIEEGFGITLVEAMAVGLPVVATNVGGIPEVVEQGVTGLLVPPADPAALAGSIERLLTNPEERQQFGLASYDRARDKFSRESMVSAVQGIYERLLADSPANAGHSSALAI